MNFKRIALVGNPNSGKTALFNRLTASDHREGNYAGVTVDLVKGSWELPNGHQVDVYDLPGCYRLQASQFDGRDVAISAEAIQSHDFDCIVNVVDALNLQRHLYLTHQLRELGCPMIVLVNRIDLAHKHQIEINLAELEKQLGCPVVATIAVHRNVQNVLAQALLEHQHQPFKGYHLNDHWQALQARFQALDSTQPPYRFLLELEAGHPYKSHYQVNDLPLNIDIADMRYRHIEQLIASSVIKHQSGIKPINQKIDDVVLHRWFGLPIFFVVMYALFILTMSIGGNFQVAIDAWTHAILVDGTYHLIGYLSLPSWWGGFLAGGIGQGVATTLTFTPVLFCMFMGLGFLEHSGYMARAALIMDHAMRKIGLPGRSLVSFIIGFGCNVPAILAARHLDQPQERLMTIMMTPFMSCGARLTIYAVMVTAFFPHGGYHIIMLLYLIGIMAAILTSLLLKPSLSLEQPLPLVMEMPDYQMPSLRVLLRYARRQTLHFIRRAAKYIIPLTTVLMFLMHFDFAGHYLQNDAVNQSILALIAKQLTVIFYPIGLEANNWPATVGLISGLLAKEVVVGTMNGLYGQTVMPDHLIWPQIVDGFHAMLGGFTNVQWLPSMTIVSNQFHASAYGEMVNAFGSHASVFAFLVFALLYFPCMSTIAVIQKELGRGWAMIALSWSTILAYWVALISYQLLTMPLHWVTSISWVIGSSWLMLFVVNYLKQQVRLLWTRCQYDLATA